MSVWQRPDALHERKSKVSEARIHARNLVANWFGHIANLVVMFFLSPFIVHTLGKTEYGIWGLLGVLTGYMGLFDLGVRASTGRYIILYLGRQDTARLDETIRTGLTFFSLLGLLVLAGGFVIGLGFPYFFPSSPEEYRSLVAVLLPVLAVNVWLALLGATFSSILTAHDRFDLAQAVDLGVLAVRTVGTIAALKWGYGLLGLTAVTVGCSLLALAANCVMARRIYGRLRVWPPALPWARLRELFGYGIAASIATVAYKIIGQTDLIIVGALISVGAVTVYSVGAMLVYYSETLVGKISVTLWPATQRAAARGETGSVRWYYLRQVRMGLVCGIPLYIGFIIFGQRFIRLWMEGPEFSGTAVAEAAIVMAILSASKLVYLPATGAEPLLDAMGRIKSVAAVAVVEAVINLGLSIFFVLVTGWGLAGVAAGTLASRMLVRGWVVPWMALRQAGLSYRSFFKVAAVGLGAGAAFAAWCYLVKTLIPAESWLLFAVQVALALVGYAPIAFLLLISEADRRRVFQTLRAVTARGGT